MFRVFSIVIFLSFFFHDVIGRDFCVADLKKQETPSGYPCKSVETVTADDFYTSQLNSPGISISNSNSTLTAAFVMQLPALNAMGFSIGRASSGPGGGFPMHSHPDATEVIYQTVGSTIAGFISSANIPYIKKLNAGDVMVLPEGLFHFAFNGDDKQKSEAVFFFNNPNPSVQVLDYSLFGNNLDTAILEKTTSISKAEIERLKAIFKTKA